MSFLKPSRLRASFKKDPQQRTSGAANDDSRGGERGNPGVAENEKVSHHLDHHHDPYHDGTFDSSYPSRIDERRREGEIRDEFGSARGGGGGEGRGPRPTGAVYVVEPPLPMPPPAAGGPVRTTVSRSTTDRADGSATTNGNGSILGGRRGGGRQGHKGSSSSLRSYQEIVRTSSKRNKGGRYNPSLNNSVHNLSTTTPTTTGGGATTAVSPSSPSSKSTHSTSLRKDLLTPLSTQGLSNLNLNRSQHSIQSQRHPSPYDDPSRLLHPNSYPYGASSSSSGLASPRPSYPPLPRGGAAGPAGPGSFVDDHQPASPTPLRLALPPSSSDLVSPSSPNRTHPHPSSSRLGPTTNSISTSPTSPTSPASPATPASAGTRGAHYYPHTTSSRWHSGPVGAGGSRSGGGGSDLGGGAGGTVKIDSPGSFRSRGSEALKEREREERKRERERARGTGRETRDRDDEDEEEQDDDDEDRTEDLRLDDDVRGGLTRRAGDDRLYSSQVGAIARRPSLPPGARPPESVQSHPSYSNLAPPSILHAPRARHPAPPPPPPPLPHHGMPLPVAYADQPSPGRGRTFSPPEDAYLSRHQYPPGPLPPSNGGYPHPHHSPYGPHPGPCSPPLSISSASNPHYPGYGYPTPPPSQPGGAGSPYPSHPHPFQHSHPGSHPPSARHPSLSPPPPSNYSASRYHPNSGPAPPASSVRSPPPHPHFSPPPIPSSSQTSHSASASSFHPLAPPPPPSQSRYASYGPGGGGGGGTIAPSIAPSSSSAAYYNAAGTYGSSAANAVARNIERERIAAIDRERDRQRDRDRDRTRQASYSGGRTEKKTEQDRAREKENAEGKLSVGIDFGTTFSGIAYGSSRLFAGQIRQILSWPGSYETYRKVPTCILYEQHHPNDEAKIVSWGLEAKNATVTKGLIKCEWFKLLLSPESLRSGVPDPWLPPLPAGKNVVDVIADFLRCIWRYAKKTVTEEIGSVVDLNAADVLLTVPSGWDAAACSLMRESAIRAGLVQSSRGGDVNWRDRLQIITEPEAGAIHASTLATLHHLRPSQSFLLCDAGGGTVDTAVYKLMGQLSELEIAEMCVRSGSNTGSLFVDLKFEELLRRILKDHPVHLEPASMATFLHSFSETDKIAYHGTAEDDDAIFRFNCFNVEDSHDPAVGLEFGELGIPGRVLKTEVFDPVIEQVLELLSTQIAKIGQTPLDAIILVGGFAASEYLYTRVRQAFGAIVPVIVRPQDCDTATLRGAARYGLGLRMGRGAVSSVISPRSYCMKSKLPVEEEDHWRRPEFISVNDGGTVVCENRLSYLIAKGAVLRKGERLRSRFCKFIKDPRDSIFTAHLFVSDSEELYRYTDEGDMKELCRWTVDLAALPRFHYIAQDGGGYIEFDLGLMLDSAEVRGVLMTEDGIECGAATFEFLGA